MLQGRCGNRELEGLALRRLGQQAVDHAARERVAAAHAVDDRIDVVTLRLVELLAVVDHGFPAVVRRRERLTQRRDHVFESERLGHLAENALVAFGIGFTALDIGVGLKPEAQLGVLLVADADIDILHQGLHDRLRLLLGPELLAEVQVHRHRHAVTFGGLAGQLRQLGGLVRDRGGDARPVEPVGALHDGVEVEILRIGLGDRRVRTVVDHLRRTHRSARFEVIDAHAITAAGYEIGLHAILAQRVHRRLADLMFRELRDEIGIVAIVGARNGYVGLAAAVDDVERIGLNETRIAGRRKTQHDFT